jgi:hypothetical protein
MCCVLNLSKFNRISAPTGAVSRSTTDEAHETADDLLEG